MKYAAFVILLLSSPSAYGQTPTTTAPATATAPTPPAAPSASPPAPPAAPIGSSPPTPTPPVTSSPATPPTAAVATASSPVAPSPPATPADVERAKSQTASALLLVRDGRCAEALPVLEAAQRIAPSPQGLHGLAGCYRSLHQHARAYYLYKQWEDTGSPEPHWRDSLTITSELKSTLAATGSLKLQLAQGADALSIDGAPVPLTRLPAGVRLDPGTHRVQIDKSGFESFVGDVTTTVGAETELTVSLEPWVATGHLSVAEQSGQAVLVEIDGSDKGPAPWQGDLTPGEHVVRVHSDRLASPPQTLQVTRKGAHTLTLVAAVVRERLTLASTTPGASAQLDAQPIALPYDALVPLGNHTLSVTAPGYAPLTHEFALTANAPLTLPITLTALATQDTFSDDEPTRPGQARRKDEVDTLRFGVLLGIISLPRPLNIEAGVRISDWGGLGLDYSFIPDVTIANVDVKVNALQGVGRIFPFRGAFYLGLGVGYQTLRATAAEGDVTAQADLSGAFITPQLGWLWTWKSGFSLGLNLGLQIPLSPDPEIKVGDDEGQFDAAVALSSEATKLRKDAEDIADLIAGTPLPAVDLLKLGFYF